MQYPSPKNLALFRRTFKEKHGRKPSRSNIQIFIQRFLRKKRITKKRTIPARPHVYHRGLQFFVPVNHVRGPRVKYEMENENDPAAASVTSSAPAATAAAPASTYRTRSTRSTRRNSALKERIKIYRLLDIPNNATWDNLTNEQQAAYSAAKKKEEKRKEKKQQKISEKRQATRASRLANEAAHAAAERADKEAKSRKTRANREARAAKFAALKENLKKEYAARIADAKAKRATGNAAVANAMEDEIREEIRDQFNNENQGETGLEEFFKNLGL
jgi:hypothetical protein